MEKTLEALNPLLFDLDGANVFAVLDAAAIPDLIDKLYGAERPEFECLYSGDIAPDLARAAPYLVRLDPEAEFTEWLIGQGWGKHWGMFAVAAADFQSMRRHLRHFLIVYDAKAKSYYFRFYDPRVLRTYLPSCSAEELATFFGPVRRWVMEGEDPAQALRFELAEGKLAKHEDALAS